VVNHELPLIRHAQKRSKIKKSTWRMISCWVEPAMPIARAFYHTVLYYRKQRFGQLRRQLQSSGRRFPWRLCIREEEGRATRKAHQDAKDVRANIIQATEKDSLKRQQKLVVRCKSTRQ
jgi:hypothetical protein